MSKIIVIVHRSAGNSEVGSMWHDSYEFEPMVTLAEVIAKVAEVSSTFEDIVIPVRRN